MAEMVTFLRKIPSVIVNERDGNRLPYIYGCVTTGNDWKFLKMEQKIIYTDITTYYLKDVGQILGIFQRLIEDLTQGVSS